MSLPAAEIWKSGKCSSKRGKCWIFVGRGAEQKNCGSPIYDFPIRMLRKLSLQRNGVCFERYPGHWNKCRRSSGADRRRKTGELFQAGDDEELTQKVKALWQDRERCENMRRIVKQYILIHWKNTVKNCAGFTRGNKWE